MESHCIKEHEILKAYLKHQEKLKDINVAKLLMKLAKLSEEDKDVLINFILR